MEAAVENAKSDPFLETGGTIHVSQMMEMPWRSLARPFTSRGPGPVYAQEITETFLERYGK